MATDTPRRPIVNEESSYHRAVHAVWERSLAAYQEWSGEQRQAVQSATDALLAWLRTCTDEDNLIPHYWEAGDAPGGVLRKHLSDAFDADDLLVLEEACFQLRLLELRSEHRQDG